MFTEEYLRNIKQIVILTLQDIFDTIIIKDVIITPTTGYIGNSLCILDIEYIGDVALTYNKRSDARESIRNIFLQDKINTVPEIRFMKYR